MTKQLSKKFVILGLASLTVAGFAYAVNVSPGQQAEVDKYPGEYQEEAYSIGQQEEDYFKSK
jgi:hypothetical protein